MNTPRHINDNFELFTTWVSASINRTTRKKLNLLTSNLFQVPDNLTWPSSKGTHTHTHCLTVNSITSRRFFNLFYSILLPVMKIMSAISATFRCYVFSVFKLWKIGKGKLFNKDKGHLLKRCFTVWGIPQLWVGLNAIDIFSVQRKSNQRKNQTNKKKYFLSKLKI